MPRRLLSFLLVLVLVAATALLIAGCLRRAAEPGGAGDVQVSGNVPGHSDPIGAAAVRLVTFNTEFMFDGLDGEGQARIGTRCGAQSHGGTTRTTRVSHAT